MNAATLYQETAVTTQTGAKLVVMLYDGAINFLKNASDCIARGDIEGKNISISRARDIVFELNSSLNLDAGGQLAQNLRSLYNFIWRTLGQANISNDCSRLEKVIDMMNTIRQSWRQITLP